jgi:hypothetical protein
MVSIDVLPDDVLLAIFDFVVFQNVDADASQLAWPSKKEIEAWQCAGDGDVSFLDHHVAWICNSFVHPRHLRETRWMSGQHFLSTFKTVTQGTETFITSLLHSGAATVCM